MSTVDTVPSTEVSNSNKESKKPLVNIKDLSQKAIRIKLTIGSYVGSKKDKKVSKEVANDHNADEKRTSLQKKLLKSEELDKVNSIAAEIRNWFYKKTAPWSNEGEGIVPLKNYLYVKNELEVKKTEFENAVDKLVAAYDDIKKKDQVELGDLYKEEDYPSKASFRSRFYVEIRPLPLQKNDFRCNVLDDDEVESINKAIVEEGIRAAKNAQIDLLNRIKERLTHLQGRLADKEGRFHASNFTNLFETLQDVEGLNITEDPVIDNLVNDIAKNLSSYSDVEAIKSSDKTRAAALDETQEAINKVNAAMKDFFA